MERHAASKVVFILKLEGPMGTASKVWRAAKMTTQPAGDELGPVMLGRRAVAASTQSKVSKSGPVARQLHQLLTNFRRTSRADKHSSSTSIPRPSLYPTITSSQRSQVKMCHRARPASRVVFLLRQLADTNSLHSLLSLSQMPMLQAAVSLVLAS